MVSGLKGKGVKDLVQYLMEQVLCLCLLFFVNFIKLNDIRAP
jgi:hypothetical protein